MIRIINGVVVSIEDAMDYDFKRHITISVDNITG